MTTPAARTTKRLEEMGKFDEHAAKKSSDECDAEEHWSTPSYVIGADWQHAQAQPLREALKVAVEVIEYYADTTNFEAVDEGRNFNEKWVVEEYNKHTVSGQPIGKIAYKALSRVADILEGHPIFQDSHTTLEGK